MDSITPRASPAAGPAGCLTAAAGGAGDRHKLREAAVDLGHLSRNPIARVEKFREPKRAIRVHFF